MAGRCGCQRACNCCTSSSDSIATTGSGGAGACFSSEVVYSADAGNRARAGTDGGVYADACLLGPDGVPIEPDENGCHQLPAACVLDYNGDPIVPDDDGCIQLPINGSPPEFGCGLNTDGDGALQVALTGSWPLDSLLNVPFEGDYTEASELFCDPDGNVRAMPEHTCDTVDTAETLVATTLLAISGTYSSPASSVLTFTNPSPARYMLAARFLSLSVDAVQPIDGGLYVRLQERIDGGSWTTVRELLWPGLTTGTDDVRSMLVLHAWRVSSVDPAGTQQIEIRAQLVKTGGGDDPTLVEVVAGVRVLGVTR